MMRFIEAMRAVGPTAVLPRPGPAPRRRTAMPATCARVWKSFEFPLHP